MEIKEIEKLIKKLKALGVTSYEDSVTGVKLELAPVATSVKPVEAEAEDSQEHSLDNAASYTPEARKPMTEEELLEIKRLQEKAQLEVLLWSAR